MGWPPGSGKRDLLFRSPLLGVAGFLTCADSRHIARRGLWFPQGFPGFSLADHWQIAAKAMTRQDLWGSNTARSWLTW
jgi:hypothetical protein